MLGPVCPSDKIGDSDRDLIMRSAMEDGTLLQPSRPATQLDMMFVDAVFGKSSSAAAAPSAASGAAASGAAEIWFADTTVSNSRFGVLFAARLGKTYKVDVVNDLGFNLRTFVAVEANTTDVLTAASFGQLVLTANDMYDFYMYNFANRFTNGWAVLGEVSTKWVGISEARMKNIVATETDLTVIVKGAPNETVTLTFVAPRSKTTVTLTCPVGEDSSATFSMPAKACY